MFIRDSRKDYATKRNSNGTVRRYFNGNVILHVSREVIKNKLLRDVYKRQTKT